MRRLPRGTVCPAWLLAIILLSGLAGSGCSSLQPVELPEVYAPAPARAPLWSAIEQQRSGDWVHLLNGSDGGNDGLEWRLRLIDSATRTIDLQSFLWDNDASGATIMLHLTRAADRGVKIRLLLDDTFTATHANDISNIDHHPNIEYRIYNPFERRTGHMVLRQILNLAEFHRLDHRMHNKVLIADNRVAITGGRNMADEYFGNHDEANFRDMDLLSGGPHVFDLSEMFDRYWNNPWSFPEEQLINPPNKTMAPQEFSRWLDSRTSPGLSETPEQQLERWLETVAGAASAKIRLVADQPATGHPANQDELPDQLGAELVGLIDGAREELIAVSAYLIPTPVLERAVERAVDRGVKVRLLTNSLRSNNHLAAHSAYRRHIHRLLQHGAQLYEVRAMAKDRHVYMRGPVESKQLGLHAKLMVIDDDLAVVGSANMDPRSLRLNTEMGLVIRSTELNRRIRELVEFDFLPRNAWRLELDEDGQVLWVADDEIRKTQPAESAFQRLEDWFLSILPIEGEM